MIAGGLIFGIVGLWVFVQYVTNPSWGTMDDPHASAFVKGSCGDAMKISLMFKRGRVSDAKYWTDGCRMSNECGAAAARLAMRKTPEELADVDHLAIEKEVGVLPDEDRHCATLAAGALQECLKEYLVGPSEKVSAGDTAVASHKQE